jgi:hypothetical protein
MRSIARIGDRKVPILISRDEEKKRSPSPDHYTGMKVFADPGKAIYERAVVPATGQLRNDKSADLERFDCGARSCARGRPLGPPIHHDGRPLGPACLVEVEGD